MAWFYLKQIVMWTDVGNTAEASRVNESKTEIKRIRLISGHKTLHLLCFTLTSGALQRALPGEYSNDPILSLGWW